MVISDALTCFDHSQWGWSDGYLNQKINEFTQLCQLLFHPLSAEQLLHANVSKCVGCELKMSYFAHSCVGRNSMAWHLLP